MTKLNRKTPIPQDCMPIPDYEGLYVISPTGEVYNLQTRRRVITYFDQNGYVRIRLTKDDKTKQYQLHRIMMLTWRPVENSTELQVNHIDGQRWNYDLSNLEWCTPQENMYHAWHVLETLKDQRGENSKVAILTAAQVTEIRQLWNGNAGLSQVSLAKMYNVSVTCIFKIVHRETWAHLY